MAVMKSPGVYIVEKSAFPNSVVEVETAVPAFVGYTELADNRNTSLLKRPWRITSMAEYQQYFGGPPAPRFEITEQAAPTDPVDFNANGKNYAVTHVAGTAGGRYGLYYALRLFFQNGGGACHVVSAGDYHQNVAAADLAAGLDALRTELEPTIVVIPEAVLLDQAQCVTLQQQMLNHCGQQMKNRVTILDLWGGDKPRNDPAGDPVAQFRDAIGVNNLDYGAAYYPWLNTTIVTDGDLSFESISTLPELQALLRAELDLPATKPTLPGDVQDRWQAVDSITAAWTPGPHLTVAEIAANKRLLNQTLITISPVFNTILREIKRKLNLLPPSAAMAGIYTMIDNSRGVWKAPANVSLSAVTSPSVPVSALEQEDLNVTPQGKSINAIRAFAGEGVLVWGARTLDGNSPDWRYINVRRTMIMIEESCRLAAKSCVFEPNVANTWVTIKSMIYNFLTSLWKRGGLAGARPEDAFSVYVGLGETMTSDDMLEGILRITVLVAIVRPAEFIELTWQQQMQQS